ncbi:MAG: hypothetical protein AAF436_08235 [Myxococcota bacterium]
MGKLVALIALGAGIVIGGTTLGLLPAQYAWVEGPREARLGIAGLLLVVGFALLARDHRGSELLSGLLLIGFSVLCGWVTFYGPESLVAGDIDIVPVGVRESLGQLMFGLGVIACGVSAFLGLRRLLR